VHRAPPPVAVTAGQADLEPEARRLAERLALPWVPPDSDEFSLRLSLNSGGLELRLLGDPCLGGAVRCDFLAPSPGAIRHPLLHAVGLRGALSPAVLDLTAGLGRDAFRLAAAGCPVTLVERHPLVAALLADGMARAAADPRTEAIIRRMTLLTHDSRELCALGITPSPDIVLLDPMFPIRGKTARVKKDLQLLQRLLGAEDDGGSLLLPAIRLARRRVVVKRPRLAPFLAGLRPSFSQTGRTARYDIYLARYQKTGNR